MSWGVSACGPAAKAAAQLEQSFEKITMDDPGEQETVQKVRALLAQALATIDPEFPMNVQAAGSMGYKNWTEKTGPFQSFTVTVAPIHFTV